MANQDRNSIRREFGDVVDMTAGELEKWLGADSTGHGSSVNWGHDPLEKG